MKTYRRQIVLLFAICSFFAYLSITYLPNNESQKTLTVLKEEKQDQFQIYVMDQDNVILPLTKKTDEKMTVEQKMKKIVEAMRQDQVKDPFTGLLAKDTQLQKVKLENKVAHLYFNEAFCAYLPEQELQVLEALTWSMTQFPEVEKLKIYVNEQPLEIMPANKTPIPSELNRSIGINHFENASAKLHESDTITVYYVKEIESEKYYVPKSKRIQGNKEDMQTVVKEVLDDVSVSSKLQAPLYDDQIDMEDMPKKEGDTLILNMSNTLLDVDRSAKQEAYDVLVLSLADNFKANQVMVYVDENVVSLHGSNEEELKVSSLSYNPIPF